MGNEATIDTLAIEIEANAMGSVDGVRKLSRALTSLSKSISSVNGAGISNVASSLNTMSGAFNNVSASSGNATSGTRKYTSSIPSLISHTNRASHSAKSLAYHFGKFYANMFLIIRGMKALGKSVSGTMDYMESFNFWDVSITSATEKTSEWKELGYDDAKAYGEAFKKSLLSINEKMTGFRTDANTGDITVSNIPNLGINITDLTTFQAEIVSITSSLGLCTKISCDTSKALSMLAADMSSLKNIDLKTVMTNFQSGLIGQSRALYKYGIDITNATLQTYAYKHGITKTVSEMTQAEKMQLRMLAILDQSKVAWGDLANTLNQPANQFRVLQNGVKNLAITIGKLLMPMVSATLPYLNAMVKSLQTFFTWIANILGIKLDVENTGTGTSDIFDGIEESAEDAQSAVDKLNKSVRAFDELKVISTGNNQGAGVGSIGGGIDLSTEISNALAEYEKAWKEAYKNVVDKSTAMADAIVDAFKRKDYKGIGEYIRTGITNALNSISWSDVYSVADGFGKGLAELINGAITPEEFYAIGKTIAGTLNTVVTSALSFGKTLDWENIGDSIGDGANGFIDNFNFKAFAEMLNVWVDGLETLIGKALGTLDWKKVFKSVTDFLNVLEFDTTSVIIGTLIIKKIGKVAIGNAIASFVSEKIGVALSALGTITLPKLSIAFSSFAISPVGMGTPAFDVVANWILSGIDGALTKLAPKFSESLGKFVVGFVTAGVATGGNPIGAIIGGLFTSCPIEINWFGDGGVFNFDWTKEWFDKAKESFKTAFDGKRAGFMDIGSYIFEGIMEGFVGAFNFITEPISKFFMEIFNGICKLFGIASPAKNMKPIGKYIVLGVVEGFNETKERFTTAISNWYDKNVKPWFNFSIWNFDGVKKGLSASFESAVEAIKSIWNKFATWINDKLTINIDTSSIIGSGISSILGTDKITLGKIPTFANGGFAEDGLFMANHSEIVGKFSNGKTAVANNRQITSGIADAVYPAVYNAIKDAMKGNNGNVNVTFHVEGDPNGIFKVVRKQAKEYSGKTGNPAFDF